ncbi:MAG: low affinity iron permease family protein [Pseudobacter sp.]|uniref:low affinity iron permease family protein n=1 Tax=Pseudobacter sp. TaxID=2045420 RepID=UPI003F7DCDB5
MKKKKKKFSKLFTKIAAAVTKAAGSPVAFIAAAAIIILWAVMGPVFGYSDTWQLVINTGTTIITFLMVFIIQQSQNRDTVAIQLKLNELIACNEHASNRLVDIEDLTEEELAVIKKFYTRLSRLAEKEGNVHATHSIDEANDNQEEKSKNIKKPATK